jgi:hypothetical protein
METTWLSQKQLNQIKSYKTDSDNVNIPVETDNSLMGPGDSSLMGPGDSSLMGPGDSSLMGPSDGS